MQRKLAIIHYLPVAYYPPALNLLEDISRQTDFSVSLYTRMARLKDKEFNFPQASINFLGDETSAAGGWKGFFLFFWFQLKVLFKLLCFRPHIILYYESLSATGVAMYKLLGFKPILMAHYHEYFEPPKERKLPLSQRASVAIEKILLYSRLDWLSHTNSSRLQLFLKDIGMAFNPQKHYVLPNYPPENWLSTKRQQSDNGKLRLVYIGSLSANDFYLEELFSWVSKHPETLELVIYSYAIKEDVNDLLDKYASKNIFLIRSGVQYYSIPEVLAAQDIGLILYKPFYLNTKLSETNKLFEYLICGLDVIYPAEMELITRHAAVFESRLFPVNFEEVGGFKIETLLRNKNRSENYPKNFVKEETSGKIIEFMRSALKL